MATPESLDVRQWLRSDAPRPLQVLKPEQVGCWTKESARSASPGKYLYGDQSGLPHFVLPPLPLDLNAGYPDAFERKPEDESTPVEVIIQGALHPSTLANHNQQQQDQPTDSPQSLLQGADVVTFRNNMNKICGTPLNPRDGWVIVGCMHGDTLFLDIHKTELKPFPDQDLFNYYGYKFESLCTAPHTHTQPGGDGGSASGPSHAAHPIVDSTSEFAVLVKVKLGGQSILMAAEVDCVDPQSLPANSTPEDGGSPRPLAYMELKTHKLPDHEGQRRTLYAHKYPRWWLQSFLAGVPEIVLGGRDQQGSLKEIKRVPVRTMQSESASAGQTWDAWKLLRFGEDVLSWMQAVGRSHPGQTLRFEYVPYQSRISYSVLQGEGTLGQRLAQVLPS